MHYSCRPTFACKHLYTGDNKISGDEKYVDLCVSSDVE